MTAPVPLIVDLDGTLTPADVTVEGFVAFARGGLRNSLLLLGWLMRGRAFAKAMVARRLPLRAETLPLRSGVLALIEQARAKGRPVILASASHGRHISRVARVCGTFDLHWGAHIRDNRKGLGKLALIRTRIGDGPFDYVGDARADAPIWAAARKGYSLRHIPRGSTVERIATPGSGFGRALLKTLRPHQWAKNALVFVPLATAGLVFDPPSIAKAALGALLFSLIASGIYQINDLLDIDADRAHATKKKRPIAAGEISVATALLISAALLLASFAISVWVFGWPLTMVLAAYLVLTTAYSFKLKAAMTLDVIALACLYTIRILAGAVAIGVSLSFWLLLFSIFFFLSLGYLKRYTELADAPEAGVLVKGRGYMDSDLEVVGMSGIAAGMVSILVMALFINDIRATGTYATPDLLWLLCLCLLYWINRVWMMARRGEIDGDPVAFAIKDPRSLAIGAIMAAVLIAARFVSWP
jgi:4-hydroxybenzoate polyprenyltransferase